MKPETKDYIRRLREIYQPFGEVRKSELDWLDQIEDSSEATMLIGYREHPITESLLRDAVNRYHDLGQRLLTDREMSDNERIACFVGMDWAKWYIDIASQGAEKLFAKIDREVLDVARLNKLVD